MFIRGVTAFVFFVFASVLTPNASLGAATIDSLHHSSSGSPYEVTDLGAATYPVSINDQGQIVGTQLNATHSAYVGVLMANGKTVSPKPPKSDPSATFRPTGINDSSVVVGDVSPTGVGYWASAHSSPFVEINLTSLTFPDGKPVAYAYLHGIDNAGDAVGYAASANDTEVEALEIPGRGGLPVGKPELVSQLGSDAIVDIAAINPPYLLTSVEDTSVWKNHLIVYDQKTGVVTDTDLAFHHESVLAFGDLTDTGSVAWVNNALQPVIRKIDGSETVLAPTSDDLLGPLMNNAGMAVGDLVSGSSPYTNTPTVWSAAGDGTSLNSLAAVQAMGLTISSMTGIDAGGDMVGTGLIGGATHGFLLMRPKVSLSGTLRISDCGDSSCQRAGAKDEQVNVEEAGSATPPTSTKTAADGSWSVSVPPGKYVITPPQDFIPASKTVDATSSGVSGIDFAVCGNLSGAGSTVRTGRQPRRDAASGQSACPDSVNWKMENRTIEASVDGARDPLGLTDKSTIYAPFTVNLNLTVDGTAVSHCSSSSTWKWTVAAKPAGAVVSAAPKPGCTPFMQVSKQGAYKVVAKRYDKTRLRQTITKTVNVHDLLILAMGDSNGSGEGNPPFYFNQCNRSTASYQYQAANLLQAQSNLHTSVTFVTASCSGARIQHLIDTNYAGIRPGSPLPPQISQLKNVIAPPSGKTKRTVDALIVSIGVNNLAFGPILDYCVKYSLGVKGPHVPPCQDSLVRAVLDSKGAITSFVKDNSSTKTLSDTIDRLVKALPAQYARLGYALSAARLVKPSDVYITQYPSFFYGKGSTLCTYTNSGITSFKTSTWHWLEGEASDLNTQVVHAARSQGWTLVPVPARLFYGHGYCSSDPWFVGIATAKANANMDGAFHPTERGAHVSGVLVMEKLCDQLDEPADCKSFPEP